MSPMSRLRRAWIVTAAAAAVLAVIAAAYGVGFALGYDPTPPPGVSTLT